MTETEQRSQSEELLYRLYQKMLAEFADYRERLKPQRSPQEEAEARQCALSRTKFEEYLRLPAYDADVQRAFVEQILVFGSPAEEAELRAAFSDLLAGATDRRSESFRVDRAHIPTASASAVSVKETAFQPQ